MRSESRQSREDGASVSLVFRLWCGGRTQEVSALVELSDPVWRAILDGQHLTISDLKVLA